MARLFLTLFIALILGTTVYAKEKRDAASIKREQEATSKQIKETAAMLDSNTVKVKRELNRLNLVTSEIAHCNIDIDRHQKRIDSLQHTINLLNDSVALIERDLKVMRNKYAKAVRKIQSRQGDMSTLSFIFAADNFTQAYRRMRYLRQFSSWRQRKAEEIKATVAHIETRRKEIERTKGIAAFELGNLNSARHQLQERSDESAKLVESLKKEEKTLKNFLEQKEREAQELDRELERIIEQQRIEEEKRLAEEKRKREEAERQRLIEEKRQQHIKDSIAREEKKKLEEKQQKEKQPEQKPADRKLDKPQVKTPETPRKRQEKKSVVITDEKALTSGFLNSKGRLPLPVEGRYNVVKAFGVHPHPSLKYIKTQNSGIDIEASSGCKVKAVYDGIVSAIFMQPGYNNIIMLRHGKYLTIYTNIDNITVKKGDTVKSGQTLGQLYIDTTDGNRSILHFEIRNETEKLNPAEWLKM